MQRSFAEVDGFRKRPKVTRREAFLAEMEHVVPWSRLEGLIAPHYPVAGRGRRPYALGVMAERGEGIGSYLLCAVLTWLKDKYPTVQVATGWLSYVDGASPENRLRRDGFYRHQGFHIHYRDPERGDGSFWAPSAVDLTPRWNTKRVSRISAWDAVSLMTAQARELYGANTRLSVLQRSNGELYRRLQRWHQIVGTTVIAGIVAAYVAVHFSL